MPQPSILSQPWRERALVGACLACLFLYEEMVCSGLMLTETPLSTVMYPLYYLVQVMAFLPLLFFPNVSKLNDSPAPSIVAGLFMLAGASVSVLSMGASPIPFPLALAGFLLAALGPAVLKPTLLLRMTRFSLSSIKIIVFGALLARFFVMLLPMLLPATASLLVLLWGPLATALWLLSRRTVDPGTSATIRVSIAPRALVPVAAAFVILTVGCTALSPLSVDPSFSYIGNGPFGGAGGWVVTQSTSALIIFLLLFALPDLVYAAAAKTIGTAAILSFVVFMGAGAIMVSWDVSLVALNLLAFVPLVAMVDFASYAAFRPGRVIGGYLVAYEAAVALGSLLGIAEASLAPLFGTVTILGLALCCIVVFAVVWLATEKNMDRFFWGQPLRPSAPDVQEEVAAEGAPSGAAPSPATDTRSVAEAIATECGLTARETDVLELLTRGRSSTFIAEELCLSPNTVRTHISRIYMKCDVHSKQELLTLAQSHEG